MNKEILSWHNKKNILHIAQKLTRGGVVAGSSDTVLGLLAEACEHGLLMLNKIKGRSEKPYIILIGDKKRITDFTNRITDSCQALIDSYWPGPLTIIVKAKEGLPPGIQSPDGTIALRVPQHKGLLELLGNVPALFSTSANKTGMPIPLCLKDIDPSILQKVDILVADDPEGCTVNVNPSTIIDCTGSQLRVIREGAYSIDLLERVAGEQFLKP